MIHMRKGTKITLWIVGVLTGLAVLGFALLFLVGWAVRDVTGYDASEEGLGYAAPAGGPMFAELSLSGLSQRKASPVPSVGGGSVAAEVKDRLIIKNGWESVVVEDVPASVKRLTQFVEQNGGFVVSSDISDISETPSAEIVVRIPVEKLDAAMAFVKEGSSRVVSESVTGEDVTEEFVDQKAHLKNLEAQEARYREILGRANTVEEVLQVQQYINNTRDEINRTTARIKYLEESAKFSRLIVNMATDEVELPIVSPGQKWRPGLVFKQSVRALVVAFRFLANMVIRLAVLAPIWLPIGLVIWWFVRRHRRKNKK